MKIIAEKSALLEALVPAAPFASNKNTIAATEGILFKTAEGSCQLSAYDLEKGIKTEIDCEVEQSGSCVINAQRLTQIIRTMPEGEISLEVDERSLRTKICGRKAQFELQALSANDFPDLPDFVGELRFEMKQCDLRELLSKTQFAIAVNSPRPELNGLNLSVKGNKVTAVSCDGSRLALFSQVCDIENKNEKELEFDIIIPGKTVSEIFKFISDSDNNVEIRLTKKHIIFFVGRLILFTRLIEAKYVDYDRFIPKNSKIFASADTKELLGALERAMLVTEERGQSGQVKSPVICNFSEGMLKVTSSSVSGRACDEIETFHEGEEIEIGFNCRYLFDAIKVCSCDRVKMSLTSALMGMTVEQVGLEEGKEFLLLILPVRLNK